MGWYNYGVLEKLLRDHLLPTGGCVAEKLEEVVEKLNSLLRSKVSFCYSTLKLRREGIGENEMGNPEFMEDLIEESNQDDDPLLVDEDSPLSDGAWVSDGGIHLVDNGCYYLIPVEDIQGIEFLEAHSTYVFTLLEFSFRITWVTEDEIPGLIEKLRIMMGGDTEDGEDL